MAEQSMSDLSHVYWIGGSPCAGKSTIAQTLADRYNLHYYQCDSWFDAHQQCANPDQQPLLHKLTGMSCDELWLPPVAEQVAREIAIYREEFAMILADLAALPRTQPILAEGAALLPAFVANHLTDSRHAIWITPTPAFQRFHYTQRPWIHDVVRTCSDPILAFDNWMARDEAFAQVVNEQAMALRLSLLIVDGSRPLFENTAFIEEKLGLGTLETGKVG